MWFGGGLVLIGFFLLWFELIIICLVGEGPKELELK